MDFMDQSEIHIPAGTYYPGDPCYLFGKTDSPKGLGNSDSWTKWLKATDGTPIYEAKMYNPERVVVAADTRYGDGMYTAVINDTRTEKLAVDAAMIGLVQLCDGEVDCISAIGVEDISTVVELGDDAKLGYDSGFIYIESSNPDVSIVINTNQGVIIVNTDYTFKDVCTTSVKGSNGAQVHNTRVTSELRFDPDLFETVVSNLNIDPYPSSIDQLLQFPGVKDDVSLTVTFHIDCYDQAFNAFFGTGTVKYKDAEFTTQGAVGAGLWVDHILPEDWISELVSRERDTGLNIKKFTYDRDGIRRYNSFEKVVREYFDDLDLTLIFTRHLGAIIQV